MENEKMTFELPLIEFVEIENEDIITTSGVTKSFGDFADDECDGFWNW